MTKQRQLPDFATAPWYSDPSDHRCPHDAWLEKLEIDEPATGKRNESRSTSITLRLLGAYHDGHIVLRYHGVRRYSLATSHCERGLGDWLEDNFSISTDHLILHLVKWAGFRSEGESHWSIEAEDVSYEWVPKSSVQ
ncbi:MAG: hypothetical protein Q8N18_01670 [Opitutaceae bacterium]|nr:hypothetical protein [Opitutaceae bacterium]